MEANEFINDAEQNYEEVHDTASEYDYGHDHEQEVLGVDEASESGSHMEVKVSTDDGETWERRRVNMADGLDESGLCAGELFIFNGEKYRVLEAEYGLKVEPAKKPAAKKKKK